MATRDAETLGTAGPRHACSWRTLWRAHLDDAFLLADIFLSAAIAWLLRDSFRSIVDEQETGAAAASGFRQWHVFRLDIEERRRNVPPHCWGFLWTETPRRLVNGRPSPLNGRYGAFTVSRHFRVQFLGALCSVTRRVCLRKYVPSGLCTHLFRAVCATSVATVGGQSRGLTVTLVAASCDPRLSHAARPVCSQAHLPWERLPHGVRPGAHFAPTTNATLVLHAFL
ncbi:hypothetical protein MRX96_032614 [Rhipicephalus microplus]